LNHGTSALWQGLPVLVVVLIGGFTTNFIWCVILNIKNRSGFQYFTSKAERSATAPHETTVESAIDAPSREMVKQSLRPKWQIQDCSDDFQLSSLRTGRNNLVFQFFFYTMGETQMGRYAFSSWTLHMASIIIFSTLWGLGFKEWKGAGTPAMRFLVLALFLLVGSTVIVGYGNMLGTHDVH